MPKHGKVRLIATVDEEVGGQGSLEMTDKGTFMMLMRW